MRTSALQVFQRNIKLYKEAELHLCDMNEESTLKESVFRAFLEDPKLGPSEVAAKLNANYNSVKAVFSQLCGEGLLVREGRGNYTPNVPRILLHLLDRIRALEKGVV